MPVTRPTLYFKTKQIVESIVQPLPLVGFENIDEKPLGWQYEIKRWAAPLDLRLPRLDKKTDIFLQGIDIETTYKSGVASKTTDDLKVLGLTDKYSFSVGNSWLPKIKTGQYFNFDTKYYYFSDSSIVKYLSSLENENDRNVLDIEEELSYSCPIVVASYKRDPITWKIEYDQFINHVPRFTGIYEDGVELETFDNSKNIIWDNVDYTKKEFLLSFEIEGNPRLLFNRNFIKQYGVEPVVVQDLVACVSLGTSNGSAYQSFMLSHFPVEEGSFKLYVEKNGVYSEEWEIEERWNDLLTNSTDKKYFVDNDLGIVYFATVVPSIGSSLFCSYSGSLRVEYEQEGTDNNILAIKAETSPTSQFINQGFICITHEDLSPYSISLEIDKPRIPYKTTAIYGPITAGQDYAILKATVKSYSGVLLPGVEVYFNLNPSNLGYLNGSDSSASITNGKGEAFVSYQSPTSAADLGYYININNTDYVKSSIEYPGSKELIISDLKADLLDQEDSIYLYQILKDDIIYGYDNVDDYIDDNFTKPPWVLRGTEEEQEENEMRWREEIKVEYDLKDWETVNSQRQDGTIVGRKVVVYTLTKEEDGIVPETGNSPAYLPLRPTIVNKTEDGKIRLLYPEDAIIAKDEVGSDAIAGYWIVSSKNIRFKASCWSPRLNRTIYSNEILASVALPQYMLGEYVKQNMQKIPYGWRLPSLENDSSSALDGATFITINPHSGPYKVLNLIGETEDHDWADAPYRTIHFLLTVEEKEND